MAEKKTFTNIYCAYLKNMPYVYPVVTQDTVDQTGEINTGWQVLPLMLWRHFATNKQWHEMCIEWEAYAVDGFECTIFNPVPLTSQLAIQGTTIFTTFNNTIYGWGYQDDCYETGWFPWLRGNNLNYNPNLQHKEGLTTAWNSDSKRRNELPVYSWPYPHIRPITNRIWSNSDQTGNYNGYGVYPTAGEQDASSLPRTSRGIPTGVAWDPLNRPDKIMELRPGKNAMTFSWQTHSIDQDKWFNLDELAWWFPYAGQDPYTGINNMTGTKELAANMDPERLSSQYTQSQNANFSTTPQSDYTMPNLANCPILPTGWWWKEMHESISLDNTQEANGMIQKPQYWQPGTEYQLAKFPPSQCFAKLLPIFDSQGIHIEISACTSIKVQLHVRGKKRRSALYSATWGPFNWKSLYSAQPRFQAMDFSYIRYKTAGIRNQWRNRAGTGENGSSVDYSHPRETPYFAGGPQNLQVRFTREAEERVVIERPQPTKRRVSPEMPIQRMEFSDLHHSERL